MSEFFASDLWTGFLWGLLGVINPALNARVDWVWFIASQVAFATPYAILILHQYGKLIPLELDESAMVDGATPGQIYRRIYVQLMAPALVAVGVYAPLLAWNE